MRHHVEIHETKVRELSPVIARHLIDEALLTVYNFVVGKTQNEVLGERIHHREAELVVMPFSRVGIGLEIIESIVHPAHVPLMRKPEAAVINGM